MTAQVPDTVTIDGVEFSIAGVKGSGLIDPETLGFKPRAMSTACYRGFVCSYEVVSDRLILERLVLGGGTKSGSKLVEPGDQVLGRSISRIEAGWLKNAVEASGLSWRVDFTGGLLLGAEFVRETYRHMGFHPAWKFRHVVEVVFDSGQVTERIDRSDLMAELRSRMTSEELRTEPIDSTFTLDYGRSGL